jgi:hypothetical protein
MDECIWRTGPPIQLPRTVGKSFGRLFFVRKRETVVIKKWQKYEEEAAAFFGQLGLEVALSARVKGARAVHAVDVLVTGTRAGIEQMWIVECKRRLRALEKVHVAALAEIVQDTGADRGILVCEAGFQSGAIRLAQTRNVTLTSLRELRENAAGEVSELGLRACMGRIVRLQQRILDLQISEGVDGGGWISRAMPGAEMNVLINLTGRVSFADMALREAELDRWPVLYGFDAATDRGHRAASAQELLAGLEVWLGAIDSELQTQETAADEQRDTPGAE